jgi:competence protein ComEA
VALLVATALCVAAWIALSARPDVQAMPEMTTLTSAPPPEVASASASNAAAASDSFGPSAPTGVTASPGQPSSAVAIGPGDADAAAPPSGTGSPAGSPAELVVVDVAGRVRRPGIVTLPVGARVADALDAAGGPQGRVDLTTLNLARVLLDGEQLLVGVKAAVPPPAPTGNAPSSTAGGTPSAAGGLVNLNTATEAELDTLPGVGPVTAQAILAWRTEHGSFSSVEELLEVSGIGEVTLEELRPLVTV